MSTFHEYHTGFKSKLRKAKTWVLGSGKARRIFGSMPLNPSGDWTPFIPQDEVQIKNGLETNSCVVFNTNKALITLGNFSKLDFPKNASERYGAVIGGVTKKAGINPVDFIEKTRTSFGIIPDGYLPFGDNIFRFEDFASPIPMLADLTEAGRNLIRRVLFGYEHVFDGTEKTVAEKHAKLREAAKRGTIALSVDAWHWDSNGEYYSQGNDAHWTMFARFDGDNVVVHDSYLPYEKKLRSDFDHQEALVYFLTPNASGQCSFDKNKIAQIIELLQRVITMLISPTTTTMPTSTVSTPTPVTSSPEVLLWDTPKQVYHSIRVMCDNANLSLSKTIKVDNKYYSPKDILCACIYQESRFNKSAVGKINPNGTKDYGLCQYNNGKNSQGVPLWIGVGATFKDTQEVLDNPEKNVSVMIEVYKQGHLDWWSSYKLGDYKQWLSLNSPMWLLK